MRIIKKISYFWCKLKSKKMRTVIAVANFFIEKGVNESVSVSPMKLQKLLYFSFGWYSAFKNEQLFDKNIQAWTYGPVIPDIYQEVKSYGNMPISSPISKFFGEEGSMFSLKLSTPKLKEDDDKEVISFLNSMWKIYSKYSAIQLSEMTHQDGTPWDITVKKYGINVDIQYQLIKDYFNSELEKLKTA